MRHPPALLGLALPAAAQNALARMGRMTAGRFR